MHCEKMAVTDMFRQRAVIEFLVKEGNSAGIIYERLRDVCGDVCMGASSVRRWVEHFKDGNTDIANQSRCGQPRTATTERNKQKVDELIRQDRRITARGIAKQLTVGHHGVEEMMENLGYRKFVPTGFPVCLRVQRNTKRLGTLLPSTLQSKFGSLRLPLVRILERSPERSPLRH
jgi:transposase